MKVTTLTPTRSAFLGKRAARALVACCVFTLVPQLALAAEDDNPPNVLPKEAPPPTAPVQPLRLGGVDMVRSPHVGAGLTGGAIINELSNRVFGVNVFYIHPITSLMRGAQFKVGLDTAFSGALATFTIPVMFRYSFDLGRPFEPYLEAGVGYYLHFQDSVVDHGFQFAQIGAGMTAYVNDTVGIGVQANVHTGSLSLHEGGSPVPGGAPSWFALGAYITFIP